MDNLETALYLIPSFLGETPATKVFPPYNTEIARRIRHFIVEDVRTARRFLKALDKDINIDELSFVELNRHTKSEEIAGMLAPLEAGFPVGVISEAGCPAVADPGADVVAIAQSKGLRVVPLTGPSSIIMSVMASGFNGQSFAFNGYLPIEQEERVRALKRFEQRAWTENQTQIFIETPYRNARMLADMCANLKPQTRLCVAADITCPDEYICTKSIKDWKSQQPDLSKKPCIFLIYRA